PALELPDLRLLCQDIKSETAQFELTLFVQDTAQGLRIALEYNTDLFEATTVARLPGHFQTLLESVVAHPETCLLDLPILTEVERYQLLSLWNNAAPYASGNTGFHELFARQVEQTPAA